MGITDGRTNGLLRTAGRIILTNPGLTPIKPAPPGMTHKNDLTEKAAGE